MNTRRCSICRNHLSLRAFHKLPNGRQGLKEVCRHCVCDMKRRRRIELLEVKASALLDELEANGQPHVMSTKRPSDDPRFQLWEVVSDIQWLKSLPSGLVPEGGPRVRPKHEQNPFSRHAAH
jgi:hypothetical protein